MNFAIMLNQYHKGGFTKEFSQVEAAMRYISLTAASSTVEAICKDLDQLALSIDEASGGFAGMGNKVCKRERAMLNKLKKVFSRAIKFSKQNGIKEPQEEPEESPKNKNTKNTKDSK